MRIRVEEIQESEKEAVFDEDVTEVNRALASSQAVDYQFRQPVNVHVTYYRSGPDFFFRGRLAGPLSGTCARCLESFPFSLQKDFAFAVKPAPPAGAAPAEPAEALAYYRGDEIDLTPLVREEMIVSLPTRALCREDCSGLCPRCGVNRNTATCGCRDERVDPRLQLFRDWKPPAR